MRVLLVFLLLASIVAMGTEATVSCDNVYDNLSLCDVDVSPTPSCCDGVRKIKELGTTPSDRKETCVCIKLGLSGSPPEVVNFFSSLPHVCHVDLPYKLSPSANCGN